MLEDIGEGQTGFVAEVGVSHQFLEERLSDWLSGVNPQPLRSGVPGYHLAVDISSGLPVGQRKLKRQCSCCQRMFFSCWFYLKYSRENSFSVAGAIRSTVPISFWFASMTFFLWFGDKLSRF